MFKTFLIILLCANVLTLVVYNEKILNKIKLKKLEEVLPIFPININYNNVPVNIRIEKKM